MAYTVKYEHPHFATEGGEDDNVVTTFGIAGLGQVTNGGTIEVDADTERNFVATRGVTIEDALGNDPNIELSGSSELSEDELTQLLPPAPFDATEEVTPDTTGFGQAGRPLNETSPNAPVVTDVADNTADTANDENDTSGGASLEDLGIVGGESNA